MIQKTNTVPINELTWLFTNALTLPLSIDDEKKSIAMGEEMYRAYYVRIKHYFAFRIFDKEEAEDLAQTVFLKIFRSLKSGIWAGAGGISYIYAVARNTLIDYFRAKRHTTIVSNELVETFGNIPDSSCASLESRDRTEILTAAIGDLRKEEAEAVTFRFFSDMEYSVIAQTMGKKECTIRQLVHRGLKSLQVNIKLQELF